MTEEIENHLNDSIEQIKRETHENNIMLRQIIQYLNMKITNKGQEDVEDFFRNIWANIVSNRFG